MRILLVEDNEKLAQAVAKGLREQSFAVDIAFDGENALYEAEINDYVFLTEKCLLAMKWYKRFSKIHLEGE